MVNKNKKLIIHILIFVAVLLFILFIYLNKGYFIHLLKETPLTSHAYNFFVNQTAKRSLIGLALLSFLGSLIFIYIPVELVIIYYSSMAYNRLTIISVSVVCVTIGIILNYLLGLFIGKEIFLKQPESKKVQKNIERFGSFVIFFGYFIFFPMQLISFGAGALKFPFKKFVLLTFFALIIKFILILLLKESIISFVFPRFFISP